MLIDLAALADLTVISHYAVQKYKLTAVKVTLTAAFIKVSVRVVTPTGLAHTNTHTTPCHHVTTIISIPE